MIYGAVVNHGDSVEIEWGEEATDWHKEAVREHGATTAKEVEDAFEWRRAIDDMDDSQASRVMRGKHPKDDSKEIGRPKNPGNRPDHAGR